MRPRAIQCRGIGEVQCRGERSSALNGVLDQCTGVSTAAVHCMYAWRSAVKVHWSSAMEVAQELCSGGSTGAVQSSEYWSSAVEAGLLQGTRWRTGAVNL